MIALFFAFQEMLNGSLGRQDCLVWMLFATRLPCGSSAKQHVLPSHQYSRGILYSFPQGKSFQLRLLWSGRLTHPKHGWNIFMLHSAQCLLAEPKSGCAEPSERTCQLMKLGSPAAGSLWLQGSSVLLLEACNVSKIRGHVKDVYGTALQLSFYVHHGHAIENQS